MKYTLLSSNFEGRCADRVLACDLHSGQSMRYFDIPVPKLEDTPSSASNEGGPTTEEKASETPTPTPKGVSTNIHKLVARSFCYVTFSLSGNPHNDKALFVDELAKVAWQNFKKLDKATRTVVPTFEEVIARIYLDGIRRRDCVISTPTKGLHHSRTPPPEPTNAMQKHRGWD
ncbi:hypothetical protein Tco_0085234 [Tanacetum coccineum]